MHTSFAVLMIYVGLTILAVPGVSFAADRDPGPWSLVLYGGPNSDDSLGKAVSGEARYEGTFLVGLALNRRVGSFEDLLRFELEGQIVKHFELQNHWEGNGLFVIRWLPFPWDEVVETSFAVGDGISVASETPDLENSFEKKSRKVLNYLLFELEFSLPPSPRWALVARIHHRSGVFGLFDGNHDAANAVALGLKYRF